ncbi:leukocyte immunoglobulin-like receptor subfamily B member 3 [Trachemys scripta elegans]|uniref:leukocyte immunoglobulin-like receptor subfamily B member 3 n=1 Tax=Trachemys scripta elegans TaxID=31138 RepID=UPI001557FE58|nr:leukocyte immunoglobulin-like receptor subfamily B member 3 [Trachemys scripta elegans]
MYPKPTISLSPGGVTALGQDVTIRCRAGRWDTRFSLFKVGDRTPLGNMEPGGEFLIRSVRWGDGGRYTCYYHYASDPFAWSEPSDPVEPDLVSRAPLSVGPLVGLHLGQHRLPGPGCRGPAGPRPDPGQGCPRIEEGRTQWRWTPSVGGSIEGPLAAPVMASALTVLLLAVSSPGCWLAGQSGVWGGREYPKPTIWVSPSRVVALGGSVTIRCEGRYPGMEFFLRKAGHPNQQVRTVPDGTVAEFPIPSVSREDGGSYTCEYQPITDQSRWSYLSDPVEIIVADPSLPRPSISLSPTGVTAPGADVTIRCQWQHRDVRFFLHKAGNQNPPRHMDPAGDGAEFRIPTVGRQHRGNYSCSYRPRSEPFVSSQPSDPLLVRPTAAEIQAQHQQ